MRHVAQWVPISGYLGLLLFAPIHATPLARAAKPRSDKDVLAEYDAAIKDSDREHWAFQPIRKPPVPSVKNVGWPRNPIDAFVLSRLENKGWAPAPLAAPRALLRRVYFDLVGLPPTLAEQAAFLQEPTPAHLDRIGDDLLARPAHGERWARHWLDLVRYAESNGYERDAAKPSVWRYRDYVIRAFNGDKPFDRFIVEQLAGDELPDFNAETLIATGYYRLGPWDDEPADPREDRYDQLDDLVGTTSQVFLGLTLSCARCHNHKFDPLTMHDYYRMVAIFAPLRRPRAGRNEVDAPAGTAKEIEALAKCDRRIARHSRRLAELRDARSASGKLLPLVGNGAARSFMDLVSEQVADAEAQLTLLRKTRPSLPRGYFLQETSPTAAPEHLLVRGKASRPGPEVLPGLPTVLAARQPSFLQPTRHTTRRRLTLARWIASPDNPLTARVIVNRVWQFHFGEGLVRTPSDFGTMGEAPTHPELLGWLASRFIREKWSLKKLHRLIVTSNTYRMSKQSRPEYKLQDPENALLWRMHYRRLEVEAIRDAMLAASGQLGMRLYGPSMYPQIPQEALAATSDPDKIWKPFNEREASRRTVYAFIMRSMVVPMLDVLDLCDSTRSSAKRVVTTVAPQALTLMNGAFVNRQAQHFADRLIREAGSDPCKQIDLAYRLTLCRPPGPEEVSAMREYLKREAIDLVKESRVKKKIIRREANRLALQRMCRVMFNLNEFVYVD
jgi:hypothetical protein